MHAIEGQRDVTKDEFDSAKFYEVEGRKARNTILSQAIYSRYDSVVDLCQSCDMLKGKQAHVSALLTLRETPWKKNGGLSSLGEDLVSLLSVPEDELFPVHLYEGAIVEEQGMPLSKSQLKNLPATELTERQQALLSGEIGEKIERVLKTLTYWERETIKMRYGLGDIGTHTLNEVATILNVGRDKVRKIEARAHRKLQHPVRARQLEGYVIDNLSS